MSTNHENSGTKRELTGALAATLGLLAIACGDDDDDASSSSAGKASGGTKASGGETGSGGKTGTAGKGGTAPMRGEGGEGGVGTEPPIDITSLNALLAAEYSAITAYTAGAGLIDGAAESDPLYALRAVILKIAVDIQSQHKLHAAALVDAIEALDGVPVDELAVAEGFVPPPVLVDNPTIANVLKFAAGAERAAAVAYNQVIVGLEDAQHRFLAASIEGDETQHFIVLAALVLGLADPGPNLGLDTAEDVIPQAFVSTVGDADGLDVAPPDYFA